MSGDTVRFPSQRSSATPSARRARCRAAPKSSAAGDDEELAAAPPPLSAADSASCCRSAGPACAVRWLPEAPAATIVTHYRTIAHALHRTIAMYRFATRISYFLHEARVALQHANDLLCTDLKRYVCISKTHLSCDLGRAAPAPLAVSAAAAVPAAAPQTPACSRPTHLVGRGRLSSVQHSTGPRTACPRGWRPKVLLPRQHSKFEGLARCSQHLAPTADRRSQCTLPASLCSIRSSKPGVVSAVKSGVCSPGWGENQSSSCYPRRAQECQPQAASRWQVPCAHCLPLTSAVAARQPRAALRAAASTAAGPSAARLAELAPPPTPLLLRTPSSGPCPMVPSTLIIGLHACL
jgi:hypothetical protein